MQKRYETAKLDKKGEEAVLRDIKFVKKSLPFAKKLAEIDPKIDVLAGKRKELRAEVDKYDKQRAKVEIKIKEEKERINAANANNTDLKEKQDEIQKVIDKKRDEIDKIYKEKDEVREKHYKDKLEYEIQRDQVKHAEWVQRKVQKLKDDEEWNKKRAEEKKQERESREPAFTDEVNVCTELIEFITAKMAAAGLLKKEEAAVETKADPEEQKKEKNKNEALGAGKLQVAATKDEKAQE